VIEICLLLAKVNLTLHLLDASEFSHYTDIRNVGIVTNKVLLVQ
jgi:hypothetical protein